MLPGMMQAGFYGDGSGAPVTPTGALAYNTASADGTTGIAFDAEAYDVGGWHSTSSNTDRFTVVSGVSYIRFICHYRSDHVNQLEGAQSLNGAAFHGMVSTVGAFTTGEDSIGGSSAIIAVSSGDILRSFSTSGRNVEPDSWAAIEAVDPLPRTALVRKSGNQAIGAGSTTTLTWDTEVRDTDAFHDNSTNNSRLTAPVTGLYRATANIVQSGTDTGEQLVLSMQKNGATVPGVPVCDTFRYTGRGINAVSAILSLTAGDYIEASAFTTSATSILAGEGTWFQLEEIPAATKYALVNKSGTQAISANTPTAVAFSAEVADTSGFHDNSTNNSRLTIPSGQGITQARLSFNLVSASATNEFAAEVRKNGSADIPGLPKSETNTAGTDNLNGFGAWVNVSDGDYFELFVSAEIGQTLPVNDRTWFCIETR